MDWLWNEPEMVSVKAVHQEAKEWVPKAPTPSREG